MLSIFPGKSLFRRLSIDRHSPFVTVVLPYPVTLKALDLHQLWLLKKSIGLARSLPLLSMTREKDGGFNEH
jgi:hypothetical protein